MGAAPPLDGPEVELLPQEEVQVPGWQGPGGFKESGMGREHGVMGLQAYMEAQVINVPAA